MQRGSGRVVILNGASSVGKSTLAAGFIEARAEAGECWIVVGIDDFIGKLPWQWFDIVDITGPFGRDGLRFAPSAEGRVVEIGDVGRNLFRVYRRAVALFARHGFNVVVDEVAFDEEAARDWVDALDGLDVSWVAVRCHPDVAAERERARGDRVSGLAHGLSAVVHTHVTYDLTLDSTATTAAELVAQLQTFVGDV